MILLEYFFNGKEISLGRGGKESCCSNENATLRIFWISLSASHEQEAKDISLKTLSSRDEESSSVKLPHCGLIVTLPLSILHRTSHSSF